MNKQKVRFWMAANLMLIGVLLLASCSSAAKVGAMQSESQSVELGDAESVQVDIEFGAGDLAVSGETEKLLEADFTYNVARLKPEVAYANGTLVVRQPEVKGLPSLRDIEDFHNEWDLHLNDKVPMDLRVDMGGGVSDLKLDSLSLSGLDISLGGGESTIDLSGDWERDLDVTIDAGAGDISVLLPSGIGVRVQVETGLGSVDARDLTKDGSVYTNAAYGVSDVTLRISLEAGIGDINLEVEQDTAANTD